MADDFDVVIVGARCAGASLAARLSAAGTRTLLLDSDKLPSDMPMSTHVVHAPGMDMLDELQIGGKVREITPATRRFRAQLDDHAITTDLGQRSSYCIRRDKLDSWLQHAAVARGAELRDQTKVVELLRDGDRITGVVARDKTRQYEVRAQLVVGADGAHSSVAKLTGAQEYLGFDATRGGYWFYWPKPAVWDSAAYPYDAILAHHGDDMLYVFQCNDDLLLITVVLPPQAARAWGAQYRERYIDWLSHNPIAAPLVANNQPIGRGMGLLKARFFYKRPVGPGWALAGDAGNFKDFVTGHGITDALLGARDLSHAVLDGRPEAFEWYWRHRDATTLALYFDAKAQGALGFNQPWNRYVFERIGQAPSLTARMPEVFDRKRAPSDLVETRRAFGWVAQGLLKGRFEIAPHFLRSGKRLREEQAELARRTALYEQARAKFEPATTPRVLPQADAAE